MLLIIDNYDSFTYNLYQMIGEMTSDITVRRNDQIQLAELAELNPERMVISPGPGRPEDAGRCMEICRQMLGKIPILGVCLGHQCLGLIGGVEVIPAPRPVHGKVSAIHHQGQGLFQDLPQPFLATRYHSLVVSRESIPAHIEVTAETEDGLVMGLKWRGIQAWGIQFHPESILTPVGEQLLRNFMNLQETAHG